MRQCYSLGITIPKVYISSVTVESTYSSKSSALNHRTKKSLRPVAEGAVSCLLMVMVPQGALCYLVASITQISVFSCLDRHVFPDRKSVV